MSFIDNFLNQHKNRIIGLDIVRSIAILLVLYLHGLFLIPNQYERLKQLYYFPLPFIDGVSIFFVLSGFLIGGILLKIIDSTDFTSKDLINFWIRRWFRTLPNYFLVLGIVLLLQISGTQHLGEFNISYIFFSQNLISPHPGFFKEAWSLSIEEWFYLLFPVCCFILFKSFKSKKNAILVSVCVFLIIPFLLRSIAFVNQIGIENVDDNYRKIVVLRLDSLMFGVIGAYFYRYKNELWKKHKNNCIIFSIIIITALTLYSRTNDDNAFMAVYLYTIESLASLLMIPYFSELKDLKFKYVTFLFTYISILSYSMYLLNYSVIQLNLLPMIMDALNLHDSNSGLAFLLKYALYWILVISGSFLIYRYFEKPIMDFRDNIKLS